MSVGWKYVEGGECRRGWLGGRDAMGREWELVGEETKGQYTRGGGGGGI